MLSNDLMRSCQPEPCSVTGTIGMFGAEKGVENVLQVVGRDTASFVLDLQLHPWRPACLREEARMDSYEAVAIGHRIQRIQQQIQQDLLELLTIKREERELRGQECLYLNAPMRGA